MSRSSCRTALILIGLAVLASGCSTPTPYIVVPESGPEPRPVTPEPGPGGSYTVKPGDSLYLISFATGTDWRAIASLNGIQPPYVIYPGQVLRVPGAATGAAPVLSPEPGESVARATPAPSVGAIARPAPLPLPEPVPSAAPAPSPEPLPSPAPAPSPVESIPSASSPITSAQPPATRPAAPAPIAAAPTKPVQAPTQPPPTPAQTPVQSAAQTPAQTPAKPIPSGPPPKPGAWQWPTRGALISRFSAGSQPHKGIDLTGRMGEPVHAANSGTVVYAGSGVRGYGNLLIVKHDAVFLSAYAHNSKLLVQEGEVVRAGQKIAELGDSGTDRVKLHFEIRRHGSPVDPLKILPRR